MIKLSSVIPWCDRPELTQTLARNAQYLLQDGGEIIVVNCGGDSSSVRPEINELLCRSVRWLDLDRDTFNKGLALNIGVSIAKGDLIFLLDADILLDRSTLQNAVAMLTGKNFVTIKHVKESGAKENVENSNIESIAYSVEFVDSKGNNHNIVTNRMDLHLRTRSGPGLILLNRSHFLKVGGMNSELEGWGWDDLDLIARLQLQLGLNRNEVGSVTHITHSNALRSTIAGVRQNTESQNFMKCLASYCVGDYRGSYERDVECTWREN